MTKYPFLLGLMTLGALTPLFAQDAGTSGEVALNKTPLEDINTQSLEVRPLVTADGNTLYFSRRYHGTDGKAKRDQDIFVIQKDPDTGSWGEVKSLTELNNNRWNAVASVSPDGKELVLFNTYKKTENVPLVRTIRKGDAWTTPEEINIQGYENFGPYADFFVDFKQNILLLAIAPSGTTGEQDLYVSFPDGEKGWSEPLHMGAALNTEKSDFAPFMGADGKTLFFSSFGHNTQGGSDIYMSVRLDDTWTKWSTPVNLGPEINTPDDENYFSIDKEYENLYYSTQKEGERQGNVVKVELPEDFIAINGPVLSNLNRDAIQEIMNSGNYQVSPNGRTTNAEGITFAGWPEEAAPEVVAEDTTAAATTVADGNLAEASVEEDESVPARLRGFVPAAGAVELGAEASALRDYLQQALPGIDLAVRQQDDTTEFKLVQNILYEFNSVYATVEYQERLRKIAKVLKEKQSLKVQLIGHTDSIGSAEVNERVAKQRVSNIVQYLTKKGIDRSRVEIIGVGQSEPVATNDTDEGRNLNRRVETIIRFIE